jgi:hypothetical protein
MKSRTIVVGILVSVVAFAVGLDITEWRWWVFCLSLDILFLYPQSKARGEK